MNNLDELQRKYNELGAEIERLKNPPAKKGKVLEPLNEVDIYYYYSPLMQGVKCFEWSDYASDDYFLTVGNVYHDRESAQKAFDARKLAFKCDKSIAKSWGDVERCYGFHAQKKYSLTKVDGVIQIEYWSHRAYRFEFRLREHAQKFIDAHGEEAILNMLENY